MNDYAYPDTLVSTDWVAEHLSDHLVRILEVDVDTSAYETGHLPGAIGWNWETQLQDQLTRDIINKDNFELLCSHAGIGNDTTIVLYGDNDNWFAAYALWLFKIYGHKDVRLMDGGRVKWVKERCPMTTEVPSYPVSFYKAREPDPDIRAFKDVIAENLGKNSINLIDVRSPDEYTGKVIAPPNMPETAQRGGHIPGAVNIPSSKTVKPDGTFKAFEELKALYDGKCIDSDKETIVYCRIGERSSHTWFVLKYLLGWLRQSKKL